MTEHEIHRSCPAEMARIAAISPIQRWSRPLEFSNSIWSGLGAKVRFNHEPTYAVQQNSGYSITSSARPSAVKQSRAPKCALEIAVAIDSSPVRPEAQLPRLLD
jgi:hypothetical protein